MSSSPVAGVLLGGTFIAFGNCLWCLWRMKMKMKKLLTLDGVGVLTLSFMPNGLEEISGGETCPQLCADVRNSSALECFSVASQNLIHADSLLVSKGVC